MSPGIVMSVVHKGTRLARKAFTPFIARDTGGVLFGGGLRGSQRPQTGIGGTLAGEQTTVCRTIETHRDKTGLQRKAAEALKSPLLYQLSYPVKTACEKNLASPPGRWECGCLPLLCH